jgi:hypothetical protein
MLQLTKGWLSTDSIETHYCLAMAQQFLCCCLYTHYHIMAYNWSTFPVKLARLPALMSQYFLHPFSASVLLMLFKSKWAVVPGYRTWVVLNTKSTFQYGHGPALSTSHFSNLHVLFSIYCCLFLPNSLLPSNFLIKFWRVFIISIYVIYPGPWTWYTSSQYSGQLALLIM